MSSIVNPVFLRNELLVNLKQKIEEEKGYLVLYVAKKIEKEKSLPIKKESLEIQPQLIELIRVNNEIKEEKQYNEDEMLELQRTTELLQKELYFSSLEKFILSPIFCGFSFFSFVF